jgi:hypothetical protein
MPDENEMRPAEDVQKALDTANQLSSSETRSVNQPTASGVSDTLTEGGHCPLLQVRYAMARCGLMAEKNPWQTLAALSIAIGCGWLCSYFGLTVLVCLILYAVYAED